MKPQNYNIYHRRELKRKRKFIKQQIKNLSEQLIKINKMIGLNSRKV